jgi:endonuclease/exonuclease/phosphatase family metal-dependent hydrolase
MTLRTINVAMDPLDESPSLNDLLDQHQWLPEERRSAGLCALETRHSATTKTLRAVWFNTWLLPGGPLGIAAKPDLAGRAGQLGGLLRARYDVAALGEVFGLAEALLIFAAWEGRVRNRMPVDELLRGADGTSPAIWVGHDDPLIDFAASPHHEVDDWLAGGCLTLCQLSQASIAEATWHPYAAESGVDAWAGKGCLRCVIESEGMFFELYSTHLQAGGVEGVGHGAEEERRAQVAELMQFIRDTKNPELPALVVGDFNAVSPPPRQLSPQSRVWRAMTAGFVSLGFQDLWTWRQQLAWGPTTNFMDDPDICQIDPRHPEWCHDNAVRLAGGYPGNRIDYVWIEGAKPAHRFRLDTAKPRRVPFLRGDMTPPEDPAALTAPRARTTVPPDSSPRGRAPGGARPLTGRMTAGEAWRTAFSRLALSDHIGLEFTLFLNPR